MDFLVYIVWHLDYSDDIASPKKFFYSLSDARVWIDSQPDTSYKIQKVEFL